MKLTIGMAHYDDFEGAYFTIQDIRKELIFNDRSDLLNEIEFVIIDNNPSSKHGDALRNFHKHNLASVSNAQYHAFEDSFGTSAIRNKIIEVANTDFVLVIDCHVFLCPVVDVITQLFDFIDKNKETNDLYSGPLINDNMVMTHTHFNDRWGAGMWGQWGSAYNCHNCEFKFSPIHMGSNKPIKYVSLVEQEFIDRCSYCGLALPEVNGYRHIQVLQEEWGYTLCDDNTEPFEIFAQGLGVFFVRKNMFQHQPLTLGELSL